MIPSCLPKRLKLALLKTIDDMLPNLNDEAVEATYSEENPGMPEFLRNVSKLHEQIKAIPEC